MPTRPSRAPALAAALALLSLLSIAAPSAVAEQSVAVPVIHLEGRGHGHGVGMSQWGAFSMAHEGASASDIIATFYPGTQLSHAGGEVVVAVDRRDHVRVQLPGGGEIRSARSGPQHDGFPVSVAPGGIVDIVRQGDGYRVVGGSVTTLDASHRTHYSSSSQDCVLVCTDDDEDQDEDQAPSTTAETTSTTSTTTSTTSSTTTTPVRGAIPGRDTSEPAPGPDPAPQAQDGDPVSPTPVWAVPAGGSTVRSVDRDRTYRGLLEVTGDPGAVRVRNHVGVEDYLKGMAEVPGNWPPAAVQAQAIAARTYALRAMASAGELCDSESCQVYAGTSHESPGQAAAVDATRNVVVTHAGTLAATFYSASGGGFSANVAEGFGTRSDVPYLQANPYRTVHPNEWAIDIALTDVAQRLAYPGVIHDVRIDEVGPSGRPLRMTLVGDAGPAGVDPQDFRRKLGLRSTLFDVATTETQQAPPPPPDTMDAGVVGADVDDDGVLDRAAVRHPKRDRPSGELAMAAPPDAQDFPMAAASLAFVLLVGTWAALKLRSTTLGHATRSTLSGWTSRFR